MQKPNRPIAQGDRAVKLHAIAGRARHVRTKTRATQQCCCICARQECRSARLLHRHIKTEHGRVLSAKDSQHDAIQVNDRDRHAGIAAQRLANRRARNVRLLRAVRNDRVHVGSGQ